MSNCKLSAGQWRVISYLHHPDQLGSRTSPTLTAVMTKQAIDRGDVVEVVERGLVQARVGGEECTHAALKRLPEKPIRLRLTNAGIYRAGHDPQHLVLCALRNHAVAGLNDLMHLLAEQVSFGELCEIAEKHLINTYLYGTDVEVPIRDMRDSPDLAHARLTLRGRTFVAYQ